jgi:branched-chain amino acid aminotransferase
MKKRERYVYLNGRILSAARASVSVFDRGLLYGDGLFETMRAYKGVVFAIERHLDRLHQSAQVLGIAVPDRDWQEEITELLARNGQLDGDAWVRLTVTRGPSEPMLLPPDPPPRPTTIILTRPVDGRRLDMQRNGVTVSLLPYSRHGFIPEHKTLNYLPGVVGKVLASRHGAYEGLFVRSDDMLTEGTTSSLFVVRGGELWTTPGGGILSGVTRDLIIELAAGAGIRVVERDMATRELLRADEAFLTSSVAEVMPIIQVGQNGVGNGHPGPMTRRVQRLYRASVGRYLRDARRRTGAASRRARRSRHRSSSAARSGGSPPSANALQSRKGSPSID